MVKYLGLGKVIWYRHKASTQIARVLRTHLAGKEEVPDCNVGVPSVRKNAIYCTLVYTVNIDNDWQ
jgi:hypothetical protein